MTPLPSQVLQVQVQALPALLGKALHCFAVIWWSSDLRHLLSSDLRSWPSFETMSSKDTTTENMCVHGTISSIMLCQSAADRAAIAGHQLAAMRMSQMMTR